MRAPQYRVEAVRGDRIHDLRRVRDHVRPAVAYAHRREILQDVDAHTFEDRNAGRFEAARVAEGARCREHAVRGGDEHRRAGMYSATVEELRESLHLEKRELRSRENDEIAAAVAIR